MGIRNFYADLYILTTIIIATRFIHTAIITYTFIGIEQGRVNILPHTIVQVDGSTCTEGEIDKRYKYRYKLFHLRIAMKAYYWCWE